MNFNYILSTGDSTISGSSLNILEQNQLAFPRRGYLSTRYVILNDNGSIKEDPFYFDDSVITGSHSSLVSLNSQTLLEGGFDLTTGANRFYYSINGSGSYTIDLENSENRFIFDGSLDVTTDDVVYYDKRDFSTGVVLLKTSNGSFNTSISNLTQKTHLTYGDSSNVDNLFDNYFIYFNGQKISKGDYPDNGSTGKLFSIKKPTEINDIDGDSADVYGSGFVDYHSSLYLNGLEQDPQDFLQLYTGVYMIETGVNSSIGQHNSETETYSL